MSNQSFELIKAPKLSGGGSDFRPPPEMPPTRPLWLTIVFIILGLNCVAGLGFMAVTFFAGRLPQPPSATVLKPEVATIDWHGQQFSDPYPMLESAFDPNLGNPPETQRWIDGQIAQFDQEFLQHPSYPAWEKWFYDQLATRPLELMFMASGATNTWWITASSDSEYALRDAPQFTSKEEGTIRWESSRWGMTQQPDAVYPAPDGKRAVLGFGAAVTTDPGEFLLVDPTVAESKWVRLPASASSRVAWLPDSTGFWYEAPGKTDELAEHTCFLLNTAGGSVATALALPNMSLLGTSDDSAWLIYGQRDGDDTLSVVIRPNTADTNARLTTLWSIDGDRAWGDIPGGSNPNCYLIVQTDATATYKLVSVPLAGGEPTTLNSFLPGRPLRLEVGESAMALLSDDTQGWVCFRYDLTGERIQTLALGPEWDVHPYAYPVPGKTARIGMAGLTSAWRLCDFDPDTGVLTTLSDNSSTFTHSRPDVHVMDIKARDGTVLRATIVRPRKPRPQDPPRPTILYADGGWSTPTGIGSSYIVGPWVDAGGMWVSTEVRGSGDRDAAWVAAGAGEKKAEAVQDLLAVARHLVAEGLTTADQLMLFGEKHGGWLACQAAMTDPDAMQGVIAFSPVTDLTRITRTGTTSWWNDEFGSPGDPETLSYLPGLSPYHGVDAVPELPAFFVATAIDDTYIEPWQTFKFTARLQEKQRIDQVGGPIYGVLAPTGGNQLLHGSDEDWELMTSLLLFAGNQTGLTPSF